MKREISLFIDDISESIKLIEKYSNNLSKKEIDNSQETKDAIVRRFEVIGKAAKNIPEDFRKKYPKIPWKKIAGLRDVIIHSYFNIDLDIMWNIIKKDIPELEENIEKIKKDLKTFSPS